MKNSKEIEWLSLDELVSGGKGGSVLYVRIKNNQLCGFNSGDLVIVNKENKPDLADKVLCNSADGYSILDYSNAVAPAKPLRLVARNGETISEAVPPRAVEIVGVITHQLTTLKSEVAR